jgi:hypothetical protein
MAAQKKTSQKKALITNTVSKPALLDMVAEGKTLKQIAEHVNQLIPGLDANPYYLCKTLQQWPEEYSAAKKAQAELHAGKLSEIAERVEQGTLDPASARVSSDNRKWLAARLNPSEYGDRVAVDTTVLDVTSLHLEAMRTAMRTVNGTKA